MANSSNPFDFSDFQSSGPHSQPQGTQDRGGGFGFPSTGGQDSGFDPFAAPAGARPFEPSGSDSGSVDGFGQRSAVVGVPFDDESASTPVLWCALAGVAALAGIALAVLGTGSTKLAFVGWAVAGPLAIGLLAAHTLFDTKQRAKPFYSQPGWAAPVYWVVLAVAFVGVGLCSWSIADWAARL